MIVASTAELPAAEPRQSADADGDVTNFITAPINDSGPGCGSDQSAEQRTDHSFHLVGTVVNALVIFVARLIVWILNRVTVKIGRRFLFLLPFEPSLFLWRLARLQSSTLLRFLAKIFADHAVRQWNAVLAARWTEQFRAVRQPFVHRFHRKTELAPAIARNNNIHYSHK